MASMEKATPFAMQQPPMVSFVPCRSKPPAASSDPRHLAERGQSLSAIDLRPWLEAARNFEMNSDFEVPADSSGDTYNLDALMSSMKAHSDGKWTIQALADKIMLSRMLDNLGVPQMPALLIVEDPNVDARDVEKFVLNHLCGPNAYDVVVKPTHLSNATGVINVSRPTPSEGPGMTIDYLTWHLGHFMKEKAASCESAALQSIRPGFIVQPKYESVVDFKAPLEIRVVVLWGKARLAVWWWGHASSSPQSHRNAWLVRCPLQKGVLGSSDGWQVLHRHQGSNAGFEKALDLFERHITAMADLAEAIAASVGAPFLRSDFFVGCPTWGVRLNEVAYGSGIEYMNRSDDPACLMVDDSVAISQILREGMAQCQRRLPAQHFLRKLGVRGHSYFDMNVVPTPPNMQSSLPARALSSSGPDPFSLTCATPEDLCKTLLDVCDKTRTPSRPRSTPQSAPKQFGAPLNIPTLLGVAAPTAVLNAGSWTPRGLSPARSNTPRQIGHGPSRQVVRQALTQPTSMPQASCSIASLTRCASSNSSSVPPASPQANFRNCRQASSGFVTPALIPPTRTLVGAVTSVPGTIEVRQNVAAGLCSRVVAGQQSVIPTSCWRGVAPAGPCTGSKATTLPVGVRTPSVAWRSLVSA